MLILQPKLEAYLHATIKISYVPAGNTIAAQNELVSDPPNGLTWVTASGGLDVEDIATKVPGVEYSLKDYKYLIGYSGAPEIITTCKGSAITSMSGFVNSKQPVTVLTTTGVGEEWQQIFNAAYHIPTKLLTGYATGADLTDGCLRGDGELETTTLTSYPPSSYSNEGGPIRVLIASASALPGSKYYSTTKNVPTFSSYFAQHPPSTAADKKAIQTLITLSGPTRIGQFVAVSSKTPASEVSALQAAFKAVSTQPKTISALNAAGVVPKYVSPSQTQTWFEKAPTLYLSTEKYFKYGL